MVLDREDLQKRPALKFSYQELEQILEAMEADEDIKRPTIKKMQALVVWSRTKFAYQVQDTTLTAS